MTINHLEPCASPGPYLWYRGSITTKAKAVLTCNRPAGHDHDGQHVFWHKKALVKWTEDGKPLGANTYGVGRLVLDA